MPSRLDTYKGIMSWVNSNFVPLGMKAIEDLPKAVPGCGDSCVIAKAIEDGFGDRIESVHVGLSSINIELKGDEDKIEIDNTNEVGSFILAYDDLKFPDLIDVDKTFERVHDFDFKNRISDVLEDYDNGNGVTAWYEDIPQQYSSEVSYHQAEMKAIKESKESNKEQPSND